MLHVFGGAQTPTGMINVMSAIVGRLPPKCIDGGRWESHENSGCLGHIEDSYSHQTTANDSIIEVCFLTGRAKKHSRLHTRKSKKAKKQVEITKEDQSLKPV